MSPRLFIISCIVCLFSGLIFFAYMQEIIIIRHPLATTQSPAITSAIKKEVPLFFWHQHTWHQEKKELLWHESTGTNVHHLINNLLTLLAEEQINHKKVSVQSVLIPPSGRTVYISFDSTPFSTHYTTYDKWLFIEGILKTVRATISDLDAIHFLVNHAVWYDLHLDFSKPWPITGFYGINH